MSGDILSDVLQAVRLRGAVFFDVETSAPWVAEAPPAKVVAPHIMPDAEHVIEYHVITRGTAFASIVGSNSEPILLGEGDVVAFPQGDAHVISSAPGMRGSVDLAHFRLPENAGQLPLLMNLDGRGDQRAHLVCGFLGLDSRPFNPLLESLPRILHVRGARAERDGWLDAFTRFAVMEAGEKRAGGGSILAKLGELMFLELVRRHVESLPAESGGWLAGLKDAHVGRALNLMHARPARDWTLDGLARAVGLSRSSFAERFAVLVGIPPMQYLQRWRLQAAAARLAQGTDNIAGIAAEAGYESEAAFSRAFKKAVGTPPAQWRRDKAL